MKFGVFVLLLGAISVFATSPTRAETNAERLARGLQPRKPARLYDPSRRGALQPRQSGSTGGMNVIATGTRPLQPPRRKRTPTNTYAQGYIGVGPNGNLIYSTTPSDAQDFFFGSGSDSSTLYWTAPTSIQAASIVQGVTYPVTARLASNQPNGMASVWLLIVGNGPPQPNDATEIFDTARFPGDLNVQPARVMDYIFWSIGDYGLGKPGYIGLSNDFAAVQIWDPYAASETPIYPQEILLQTLPSTSTWDITNAMNFYLTGTKLVNPVTIFGTDATGQVMGYSVYQGTLQFQQEAEEATTFYLPLLNSGQSGIPFIYRKNGNTCTIYASGSNAANPIYAADFSNALTDPYLPVHMEQQSGTIFFPSYASIFGIGGSFPLDIFLSNNQFLSYADYPLAQPICLETTFTGELPSACSQNYAITETLVMANTGYSDPMKLYMCQTIGSNHVSGYYNLAGPAQEGAVASFGSVGYTNFYSLIQNNVVQPNLYSFYQGEIVSFYTDDPTGKPIALPIDASGSATQIPFTAPAVADAASARLLTPSSASFFYDLTYDAGTGGYTGLGSLVVSAAAPEETWRTPCAELVPHNGSPSLCGC